MFRKSILIAVLVGLLTGASFLGQGDAQTPLIVGGVSDSRSLVGSVSGESFSFISGPGFAFARSLLQDPTRFGPAGTVAETITFAAGTAKISLATLQATDIFVLTPPQPGRPPLSSVCWKGLCKRGARCWRRGMCLPAAELSWGLLLALLSETAPQTLQPRGSALLSSSDHSVGFSLSPQAQTGITPRSAKRWSWPPTVDPGGRVPISFC